MMDRARSLPWRAIGGMTALVSLSSVVGLVIVVIDHQGEEITSLYSASQANAETTRINQEAAEANRESVDELAGVVRQLQEQLRESGEEPVVPEDPSEIVKEAPEPVPPASDEGPSTIVTRPPSEAEMRAVASDVIRDNPSFISGQVAAAVTGYFVRNPPPAGPPGADGDPASPEQIAAAVATFCAGDTSPCTGPQGNDGPPGPAGEPGPAPTTEQIADAVVAYCGEDECQGDRGPGPTDEQISTAVSAYCDARNECTPELQQGQINEAVSVYCTAQPDACQSTVPGPQGPVCPDGSEPILWTVDRIEVTTTGLEEGDYYVCRVV